MKNSFLILLLSGIAMIGCKTEQMNPSGITDVETFKVAIFYPNGEEATFDMDYYEQKHMPMVAGFISDNLKYYEIDQGISGRTSDDKPPFVAIGYFFINDINDYNQAIAANREAIIGDFKNYTNIQPVIQINKIKRVGSIE